LAYITCDRNQELRKLFETDFEVARIVRGISALTGVDIVPGKTLIFLDEVRSQPRVLEALKYFCEDAPEYHVAVAGSLLGVALHSGVSFPVGKVNTMRLYPMDFEEFLMAKGEKQLLGIMRDKNWTLMSALHEKLKDLLRQYYFVGGMPEVVKMYVENGMLQQLLSSGVSNIYYFSADDSRMEMDFLVQREGELCPMEVKAEENVRANSLHNYLMKHPDIHAVRYSMLPYAKQQNMTNVPLYMVGMG